jgi:hypothetical protein
MSLFKSIKKIAGTVFKSPLAKPALAMIPGIGTGLALASTAYSAYSGLKAPAAGSVMPGAGSVATLSPLSGGMGGFASMGMLSPSSIAGAGRMVVAGGRAAARGAVNLCRKYPQWCTTIGGTAAVEALMHSGQIPIPKRRRGRGITAHELKAFKRVARFTSKYCAPVHRAMRAPAVRKGARSCQ